jgi:LEA14-like dessication related protein
MSMKWLTALALLAGLAACAPADLPEPPEVALLSLVPTEVSLTEQTLAVRLRVRNPNNAAMAVDGMRFAIEINGHGFARGTSDQTVSVPRLGQADVAGTAHVSTTDLMRQMLGAPEAKGLEYRLSGTVFLAGGGRTSFDRTGDFDFASALGGGGGGR